MRHVDSHHRAEPTRTAAVTHETISRHRQARSRPRGGTPPHGEHSRPRARAGRSNGVNPATGRPVTGRLPCTATLASPVPPESYPIRSMGPVRSGGAPSPVARGLPARNPGASWSSVAASRTHVRHAHTRAHQLQPFSYDGGHRRRFMSGERAVRRCSNTTPGGGQRRSLRWSSVSSRAEKRAGEDAARAATGAAGRRRVTHTHAHTERNGGRRGERRQQQAGTAGARRLTSGGEGAGGGCSGEGALPAQPDPTN